MGNLLGIRTHQRDHGFGFELISEIMASDSKIISKCDAEGMSLSLDMSPDYRNSRLFGTACPEIIEILQSKDVTSNSHHYCVNTTDFERYGMAERF
ncbi:hypothetical protein RvY_14604-2 [Ramazzottius varieornatus]|uniref:Uncharacterized protein n=1 Tax=Ramazzottius varieornatus TaxID=947166 RepID=A0A1D1VRV5_RAMVA|nr:hypothetical protein RvY_14604-2 [Ramazzottius varieornatus]